MSVFKEIPNKSTTRELLKKMASSLGLPTPKPNQIFKLSSLKYLNLDAEFYMISLKIKKYYKDEILNQKFKSKDIESLDNIISIYNDFFDLKGLCIGRYYIQKNIKSNLEYKTSKTDNQSNQNNQDTDDVDLDDVYYKIYSKIEYENFLKDVEKFNKYGTYIMEF
tara:strand:+ start:224 stop:718 length:495 start_codon:yes stop_codon:yes gene_type:complete